VERDVFESDKRAVVYFDLLGFAALVENTPHYFMTGSAERPTNAAAQLLSVFHRIIEVNISAEQPNHAMVFSDCGFGVFYTRIACANFAAALMRGFLQGGVPVRMGLGFGTFSAMGTTSGITDRSTVVRAMFGGTSIVRAVAAESCGGKGMRIFAHSSFSELFDSRGEGQRKLLPTPQQLNFVSSELDYASGADGQTVAEWASKIRDMARSAPGTVQNHYFETLAALRRMLPYNIEDRP
jgi:hypothetical protein